MDSRPIDDTLIANALERIFDELHETREGLAIATSEIALGRVQTEALTNQVRIANGRTTKIEGRLDKAEAWHEAHDHSLAVAEAFKAGEEAKVQEIKGRFSRAWDFVTSDAKVLVPVAIIIGLILGRVFPWSVGVIF